MQMLRMAQQPGPIGAATGFAPGDLSTPAGCWRCNPPATDNRHDFAIFDKLAKAILATIRSGQTVRPNSIDAKLGEYCN